ncbi:MAG: hypothetical protein IPL98_15815 [Saprospiraceae bacterium]|jgi:hypothetical protein|nr:hypothetical protein [Saprospiraceae bacterium]
MDMQSFSSKKILLTTGILGMFFPIILTIGTQFFECRELQNAISTYYYTNMRDFFVGILFAIGITFFCYNGYDKYDRIASWFATVSIICIAVFPTNNESTCLFGLKSNLSTTSGLLHNISATTLFITLAVMCLFLFTKSNQFPTEEKKIRNKIYKTCGIIIFSSLIFLALYMNTNLLRLQFGHWKPVFLFESIMLIAFGFAWIVKGDLKYFKDNITD